MSFEKPYEGIRVVDLSQGVAGPYCAMLLAQYGAEVIKVEPHGGDWSRQLGPPQGDHTTFSFIANLGKRSIALDLKSEEGRAIVERMVGDADVFMEGFRPGVADRLGLSYRRLSELNPRLLYLSVSGFGQEGPLREKPAMDPVLQAFTGFMIDNKGPGGTPHRAPAIIVDMATSLYAFQALSAALYAHRDEPRGRHFDVSLMQGAANLQSIRMATAYLDGLELQARTAPSGTLQTADGWIQLVVQRDHDYVSLCEILGLQDLRDDPRFADNAGRLAHAEYLVECVAAVLATKPSAHWRELFTDAGLQNEALLNYHQFIDHPQTKATGLISWLEQDGLEKPWPIANPPGMPALESGTAMGTSPKTGENSREILTDLGYSEAEIEDFLNSGTVSVEQA